MNFKVTTKLFNAEDLRNGARYRHSYNAQRLAPFSSMSFRGILSDLEWLSEIFHDTKHHMVLLRQLRFLFFFVATSYFYL